VDVIERDKGLRMIVASEQLKTIVKLLSSEPKSRTRIFKSLDISWFDGNQMLKVLEEAGQIKIGLKGMVSLVSEKDK
jgi:predicted transcriptional regulator